MSAPVPRPPRQARVVSAPTELSTGDAEIDAALRAMTELNPEALDAHLEAGAALHDLLRSRLAEPGE